MIKFRTVAAVAALAFVAVAGRAQAQEVVEYESQWDLQMIGVQAAYDRGYTGKGVVVGVMDSGVRATHIDLIANLSDISLDIFTSGPATIDLQGHGTHVAGTIAGARNGFGIQGVAYDSKLAILRLLDENNVASGPYDAPATLLNYALDNGVRIINNSWGGLDLDPNATAADVLNEYGPEVVAAYQRAVDLDAVMVWATGNESMLQPTLQAGLPYYFPSWAKNWLAVTAVDRNGNLTGYANHCGLAAQWCLAAPGGEAPLPSESFLDTLILSAGIPNDEYIAGNAGTSMAAPHVTGALAIARQMFPDAPGSAIARLVLVTATDKGAPGVDEAYGWGLLNIANLAITLDPEAGSVFANGAWAGDAAQKALFEALDDRLAGPSGAGLWAVALVGRAGHDTTDSSLESEAETAGAAVGYDIETSSGVRLGIALSGSDTTAEEAGGENRAQVRSLGFSAYATVHRGGWFVEGAGGFDVRDYDFRRGDILGTKGTVLEGLGLTGRAEADGLGAFARGRVGFTFETKGFELSPFVQARVSYQRLDAFQEAGADVFSLTSDKAEQTLYELAPGVQLGVPERAVGKALVGGSLSVRYEARRGDDDFAMPVSMLGSEVPAAVGDLDDAVAVSAAVSAKLAGGLEVGARGWWSGGGNQDAAGARLGLRLTF